MMNKALKALVFLALGLSAAAIGLPSAASAQSAIRATVNNQPVTSYDVSQRVRLMNLFHQKTSDKMALDDLIDESIAAQAAKARNIGPTDAQVEERFDAIAKQVKLAPAQFTKALTQAGVQPDTLRKFLRAQMTWGGLMRARAKSTTTNLTEADIQAEMAKEGVTAETATIKEFKLQQIVFVVPKGSSPGLASQRQREAESFRQRFPGCDNSLNLAKSLKGVVVLDMGRRDSTQVEGEVAEALQKTPAGGTLKPAVTDRGVEVIAVCSVKDIQSTAGVRASAEKRLADEQNKDLEKTFRAELRAGAKIVYN